MHNAELELRLKQCTIGLHMETWNRLTHLTHQTH